ncbi:MAG TPA: discoidin domain-containing protein [Firmicutes bacterium]|nr:discoidin domain-containing protein [Bacillota bacterium]
MKKFISVFLAVALVAVACCVFASAEDTNLALGKSYTIDGYDYDASVENYVDNETHSKLTDGIVEDVAPWDAGAPFIGISGAEKETPAEEHNGLTTAIVLDLGAVSTVNKFAVQLFGGGNGGIYFPTSVKYSYSTDNETWTEAGAGSQVSDSSVETGGSVWDASTLELDSAVQARYIKVEFVQNRRSVFISEFEVYGTAGAAGTDESEAVSEAESETVSAAESETASSAAPVESSAAASSNASSTPSTSDAGIVAVVVLAVVAVIGAAVVVKKRA